MLHFVHHSLNLVLQSARQCHYDTISDGAGCMLLQAVHFLEAHGQKVVCSATSGTHE